MFGKSTRSRVAFRHSGNGILSRPAHVLNSSDVTRDLASDENIGLTAQEAANRLVSYGPNDFGEEKTIQPVRILLAQLFNVMTLILILALAASFAIKSWVEGGVLAALIVIDVILGFFQDLKAARIVASLKGLQSSIAVVFRGGKYESIDASTVVPGDMIKLKTGDIVPADARLVNATALETDESTLTGESMSACKDSSIVLDDPEIPPGDRKNIVFSSTVVTKGHGHAIVFATGSFTEIGAIATALKENEKGKETGMSRKRSDEGIAVFPNVKHIISRFFAPLGRFLGLTVGTPLQRKLSRLFLYIFALAIVFAIVVLAANKFDGRSDVIIYAIATAIGTLPATLVLVLTITMAAGTRVMMQRNVAVRNMQSLEALGGVTNICSDKTGTLTQGKMVAKAAWIPGHGDYFIDCLDEPYNPNSGVIEYQRDGHLEAESITTETSPNAEEESQPPALQHYLNIAAVANHATLEHSPCKDNAGEETWKAKGDPTEIAIFVFACRFGHSDNEPLPKKNWVQIAEFPFDSAVKLMSVICQHRYFDGSYVLTKGAVERVVGCCSFVSGYPESDNIPMNESIRSAIGKKMTLMAQKGLRILAFADRAMPDVQCDDAGRGLLLTRDEVERDLTFRGLIGIYDPPRPESKSSVMKCHQAGIQVHMLTGDHVDTARAIAIEVGILPKRLELLRHDVAENAVMNAQDFDRLADEQMDGLLELPLVLARCTPSTKVRMISALHRRGRYVAMTGDGVNDSPSLRRADIGIAMGLNGSDVAKSVSDIILRDDNFASILNAVEEGRRIFDNVQKFMLHVLAANVGLVTTLLVGLAFRDGNDKSVFPLSPVEILFMLLVAGAFTENGLGFEAASPDILRRPPQNLKYGLLTPEFWADLVVYGLIMAACLLGSFSIVLFGLYDGQIGEDCNIKFSQPCDPAFKARSTCYTVMMWIFLLFAWELIDGRRSFFYGVGRDTRGWGARLTNNKPLFWSVVFGFVVVFPTLYIPGLNRDAFLHQGLGKEWGIVVAITIFFVLCCELWKWQKRLYFIRRHLMSNTNQEDEKLDVESSTHPDSAIGGSY